MTVPTASGPWWRDDGDPTHPVRITADLYWRRDYEKFVQPVTDDGHWIAPVLTPSEAAALTARAERAERERDELRAESAAYRAERDQMRRWAEAAAADENANAAELREVRRWFADARAAVNAGGAIDLDALGSILGGSRE